MPAIIFLFFLVIFAISEYLQHRKFKQAYTNRKPKKSLIK